MAKQVIWSLRAQNDKKEILDYWRRRNKSDAYSKKLNELFKESIKIILDFPQIGKVTDDTKARIKIVRATTNDLL
jgi:plasmid stabilization system protein ParE